MDRAREPAHGVAAEVLDLKPRDTARMAHPRRRWSRLKPLLHVLPALLTACGPGLAARYAAGNQALSSGDGPMYFVVIAPALQRALNHCIPPGTTGASPVLVIVADIDAAGSAANIDVEPDSPGSACLQRELRAAQLPRPPLAPGATSFPIGLRIDTQ